MPALARFLGGGDLGDELVDDGPRDPLAHDELAVRVPQGLHELGRPDVLEQHDRRGGVVLQAAGEAARVVLGERAAQLGWLRLEDREGLVAEGVELEDGERPLVVLDREDQVDDLNRPAVDQLPQRGRDLAFELVAGKLHNQQLDGSDGHAALLLNRALGARDCVGGLVMSEG